MTCITAYEREERWCPFLLESCKRNGIKVINADSRKWVGYHEKLIAYHDAVSKCSGSEDLNELILFADGYDTMIAAPPSEFEEKYEDNSGCVVFAAESVCWPDPALADRFGGTGKWRFLNAGLWIGRRLDCMEALDAVIETARKGTQCDQAILRDVHLGGSIWSELDVECDLFQCCNDGSMEQLEQVGNRVRNKVTGSLPCAFHGNGGVSMRPIPAWLGLE